MSLGALSTESMLSCVGHEQWDLSLNDPVALLCCLMCNVVITPVLPPSQVKIKWEGKVKHGVGLVGSTDS